MQKYRTQAYNILISKYAQYTILLLVFLDLCITLFEFLVKLSLCEHTCKRGNESTRKGLAKAEDALALTSLVFSSVFMVELIVSIWAFGLRYVSDHRTERTPPTHLDFGLQSANSLGRYFKSKFHLFDAVVIIAGFVVDVALTGVDQDIGSAVLALRLFRIVKIVEEMGNSVQEDSDRSHEVIERLDAELKTLREALTVAQAHASGEARGPR